MKHLSRKTLTASRSNGIRMKAEREVSVRRICTLPAQVNECPFYNQTAEECSCPDSSCGMLRVEENTGQEKYTRAPRWYEAFYK